MPQQATRIVAVSGPLGPDVLLFRRMSATDALARPFVCDLELLSEDHGIKLDTVLGRSMTIRFDLPQEGQRYFNGCVSRFSYGGSSGRYARYEVRLSPWLWFLTRTANCRIFQNKSVPDIVKQVFQDHGFSDFEDRLTSTYRNWDYCVQYRETDFNFVSRLMEQEGIYYYFNHEDGKHTLIMADGYGSHDKTPGYETVPLYPPTDIGRRERDHVSGWTVGQEVQPGVYVLRDFDFEKPKSNLETKLVRPCQHEQSEFEVYDYPGIYLNRGEGDVCSRLRLEERHSGYELAHGGGDVAGLSCGHLFSLANCPRDDQNREYLLIETALSLVSEEYESDRRDRSGIECRCSFTAQDSGRPWRPVRSTAKPSIQGPQTAIVVGPSGEEIWTDRYGRVKVQFHWDREGKRDENSSCWVRVSHPWAGKNWGAVAIPRIGQEVIVDFLEGDPDRPIITGRVYNADTMPPYTLPGAAVISGLKSDSTKGGGGYNEYVMDDTKGNELIREHGQFDKDSTIEHDLREHVLNSRFRDVTVDETILVGNDQTYTIGSNQTGTVGIDKTLTVGANHTESIGSNMTITIASMLTETVGINYAETVGAAMELTVGALMTETIGAAKVQSVGASKSETIGVNKSVDVGANQNVNVGGNQSTDIGGNKSESVSGNKSVSVSGNLSEAIEGQHSENVTKAYALQAKTVTVTADDEILVKTGSASISMKKNGDITIEGAKITIKGSGDVIIKGQKILQN